MNKSVISSKRVTNTRFESLWARCQLPGEGAAAQPAWETILENYSNPQRYYHGVRHLEHCLRQFDLASAEMKQPDRVEMALWFHDVVYFPDAEFCELKSAELFKRLADEHFSPGFVSEVYKLILATEHREAPQCCDEPYIVDIDLSSFGLPWDQYMRDNRALRKEMKHMPDTQYYAGKLKFLQHLLSRDRIYCTDYFFDRYERQARDNIRRFTHRLERDMAL